MQTHARKVEGAAPRHVCERGDVADRRDESRFPVRPECPVSGADPRLPASAWGQSRRSDGYGAHFRSTPTSRPFQNPTSHHPAERRSWFTGRFGGEGRAITLLLNLSAVPLTD